MAALWIELIEAVVKWLSFHVYRIALLLSILMYFILTFFSESRRREGNGWKRMLLWLAYQLTDWCPAYVINNLYLETKPHDKMIVAFWVPFLLLHNARPDNINAYISEDSELWLRVWKSMCKVGEMELSLMYDILYTKASIVHTWHGYAIRVVAPPLTATTLLLFFLQCKECMKLRPIDEPVGYILLSG